jgi:Undecaprenyl-phosphate glucose phosphotransferase
MSLPHPRTFSGHQAAIAPALVLPQPVTVAVAKFVAFEFFVVAAAAWLAGVLYHETIWRDAPSFHLYIAADLFLAAMIEAISTAFGHYKNSQSQSRHALLFGGFGAVALAFSFLMSALFLLKITDLYSRATFIFQFVAVAFAVLAARAFFHSRLQVLIAAGRVNARRVVLIGDAVNRTEFAGLLKASAIQTVGWFPIPDWCYVGKSERAQFEARALIDGCRRLRPDDILILARQEDFAQLSYLRDALSQVPVGLYIVPVEAIAFLANSRIVEFGNTVTIQVMRRPLSKVQQLAKRAFDVVAAAAGLLMLSPVLLLVAAAIKLDSPGPVFFRQERNGYNNKTFEVFKFRSMAHGREGGQAFLQAMPNDSRATRVGRLLRRTNLDELPQLLNVLRGEMSIVGPRPHAIGHNEMFEDKISVYSRRHVVKPGITGWAQVNGCRGPTDTFDKMKRRVELDLWYIDNWSLWLDLRIMMLTVFSPLAWTNAV